MTQNNNDGAQLYSLSRRKMLGGLGAVGLASAGAGLGTSAFFSDEESFENNTLTAGSLDLRVVYDTSYDSDGAVENQADSAMGTQDGDPAGMFYDLDDVKPGDSGHVEFCFEIVDNPSYMWACASYSESENGKTEPEMDDDATPEGELADSIVARLVYCEQGAEGIVEGEEIVSGSLADVLDAIRFGAPLDGDGVAGLMAGEQSPHDDPVEVSDGPDYITGACVCLFWEIPTSVGNEIQSDSLTMNFEFYALQARHNDGTTNPCVDSVVTQYDNDWKGQTLANPTNGEVITEVSFAPDDVAIRFTFEDDADGVDFLDPADYSATNLPVAIDADADGTHDFQVIWQPNAGFPDAPFGYTENNSGSYGAVTALPTGFGAVKSGNQIVFTVPRTDISATFRLLAYGSTGGEGPIAKVNADPALGPDFFGSANAVEFSE